MLLAAPNGTAHSHPVTLEGRLVDLDAEARSVGQVQRPVAKLTLAGRDRLGKQELGGEAVREPGVGPVAIQGLGSVAGGRDSQRPVKRAREVDGELGADARGAA